MSGAAESFERFLEVIRRLRAPGGCPWDREQTPASLRACMLEEAYECAEAVAAEAAGDADEAAHVCEELGDVLLTACMTALIYEERGRFSVADVLDGVRDKLVRRHPHVFAGAEARDSAEVLRNWARIKAEVEGRVKDSALDGVSRSLPPLERALKLQKKASENGFDWTRTEDVVGKVEEEADELREAVGKAALENGLPSPEVEEEMGDLLFSLVNLCRFLKTEPHLALQRANSKFSERFRIVERLMKEAGKPMTAENAGLMNAFWEQAKHRL